MRYLLACLCLGTLGCERVPGAPLTDVVATNTERTGPYEVVERTVEGKRYGLRVVAMHPDRAQTIADHLVVQLLSASPEEIVVEVASHDAPSPADRIGNRPTGQSGTAREK